jgi:starch phosphorylase
MANDAILKQYEVGPVRLRGEDDYDRHLVFDHVVTLENADQRERFEAVARSLRDVLSQRWLLTQKTQDEANAKQVYYLSMEFLLGRSLANNIINLGVEALVREDLASDPRQDWAEVLEAEPDAGLGNGGLGRLAACFIDSLATQQIPATGYGLRYEYGIFRQEIDNGWQVERPDPWLLRPDPWEVVRPRETVHVPMACSFAWRAAACGSCATARPACSACPTTGRWSATAARRSTAFGSGVPLRPTTSTSASSAPATSSAPWSIAWPPRR